MNKCNPNFNLVDMVKFIWSCKFQVRMLGSGRPFLLEIQNPKVEPSQASLREMEFEINNSESKLVKVKNLKVVNDQGWTLMREGEAEKQKEYAALVWISRELEEKDLETISSLKDLQLMQRTPVRVLHRRSPLEREKIIHRMNIEKISGSSQYFLLHLCTQAGTYIKEFVHGDLGRTQPSTRTLQYHRSLFKLSLMVVLCMFSRHKRKHTRLCSSLYVI